MKDEHIFTKSIIEDAGHFVCYAYDATKYIYSITILTYWFYHVHFPLHLFDPYFLHKRQWYINVVIQ